MKRICMGSLLGQALFVFLLAATAAYGMQYTGHVIDLEEHDEEDHITLGLDGGGDGVADLTNDYYGVDSDELSDLKTAKREGKQVKIAYHLAGDNLTERGESFISGLNPLLKAPIEYISNRNTFYDL